MLTEGTTSRQGEQPEEETWPTGAQCTPGVAQAPGWGEDRSGRRRGWREHLRQLRAS